MLTFTTLLLGLVAGEQRIELAAAAEVVRVEVVSGGRPCRVEIDTRFAAHCDLGATPAPQRLVATGFDADGRPIARAERVVNLFRAPAEVAIHLERATDGSRSVRLTSASFASGPPRALRVELDGRELPLVDPAQVELPAIDLDQPHLVRAELEWSDTLTAVGELVFGGRHGSSVTSELSAVAIESDRRLSLEQLDGALTTASGAARVVALEAGPAELLIVLDPSAVAPLDRLGSSAARIPVGGGALTTPGGDRATRSLSGSHQRFQFALAPTDRMRILWPWPERSAGPVGAVASFPPSPPFTAQDGGLVWVVVRARLPTARNEPPALVDAAAVAGMIAAGRERRRAVLVILGERDDDSSRLNPDALRKFLAALRVPLFVWRFGRSRDDAPERWGDAVRIFSSTRLRSAFGALERSLARQRIVWVEGSYLPNELHTSAARSDIRLAGEIAR